MGGIGEDHRTILPLKLMPEKPHFVPLPSLEQMKMKYQELKQKCKRK